MRFRDAVREHKMRDTFGGYDWGDPIRLWYVVGERKPLSTQEFIEELDWFKNAGASAAITLQQLETNLDAAEKRCVRAGRFDLSAWVRTAEKNPTPQWQDRRAA